MFITIISLTGRRCRGADRCNPSILHQTLCVCVCVLSTASRLDTQSISCSFVTIIWVITLLYLPLPSESRLLMVFLAELDFLSAAAVWMQTTSPPITAFLVIICLHEDFLFLTLWQGLLRFPVGLIKGEDLTPLQAAVCSESLLKISNLASPATVPWL